MKPELALEQFEVFLRLKNLRVTKPRKDVLLKAWETHTHFTAKQIYNWVRSSNGNASRATVYRTLSLLVEGGFLAGIDRGQGQVLYEHILGHRHHDHMICLSCSSITEFRNPKIEELQLLEAKSADFHMVNHSLTLEGYCSTCRDKIKTKKLKTD